MADLGEKVLVQTEVESGAFPGEKLVTLETRSGPVSGFAKADSIEETGGRYYLPAVVKAMTHPTLTVLLLTGSFFTTTGLVEVRADQVLKVSR